MATAQIQFLFAAALEKGAGESYERHAFIRNEIVESNCAGMRRRTVIQDDCGAGGEPGNEPVPHHPAESSRKEHPVTGLDVAVQRVFLQQLQERATRAVPDAFWDAGRAGRE